MASLALAGLLACAAVAYAHPGGSDRHGCHTNRKTGQYHCHRSATPASAAPSHPGPCLEAPPPRRRTCVRRCPRGPSATAPKPAPGARRRYDREIRATAPIWTATATAWAANPTGGADTRHFSHFRRCRPAPKALATHVTCGGRFPARHGRAP
nr:YHYH domain-containing protein [Pseudoxanthomonas mexicana]